MPEKKHKWISAREHRFIKKCARDKRLKSVSSTQMGIIVGHSRGSKPISRHTINRVKNKPMRLPVRKKPGRKTRFGWCEDYLVRLVKRLEDDKEQEEDISARMLQSYVEDLAKKRNRGYTRNGVPRRDRPKMPIPSQRKIRFILNRRGFGTVPPENFKELTADQKRKRVLGCRRMLRRGWLGSIDLFMDEKSWLMKVTKKDRRMINRGSARRVWKKVYKNSRGTNTPVTPCCRLHLKKTKAGLSSVQVIAGVEPNGRVGAPVSLWHRPAKRFSNKLTARSVAEQVISWSKKYRKRKRLSPRGRFLKICMDQAKFHQKLFKELIRPHRIKLVYLPKYSPDLAPPDYVFLSQMFQIQMIVVPKLFWLVPTSVENFVATCVSGSLAMRQEQDVQARNRQTQKWQV